jgi:hypothetical protein
MGRWGREQVAQGGGQVDRPRAAAHANRKVAQAPVSRRAGAAWDAQHRPMSSPVLS